MNLKYYCKIFFIVIFLRAKEMVRVFEEEQKLVYTFCWIRNN